METIIMYCNNNFSWKYWKMLGHGEVGTQQQSYCSVYTISMPCSFNKTECVQYIVFFTYSTFVNKGATPDELTRMQQMVTSHCTLLYGTQKRKHSMTMKCLQDALVSLIY
jgi:hypothetical protein